MYFAHRRLIAPAGRTMIAVPGYAVSAKTIFINIVHLFHLFLNLIPLLTNIFMTNYSVLFLFFFCKNFLLPITMNAYLTGQLLIPQLIANEITNTHGFTRVSDFAQVSQKNINTLVNSINKTHSDPDDAKSPKIVVGLQHVLRLGHLAQYASYINVVGRAHAINVGTIANITRIGRYFEKLGEHTDTDLPAYPKSFQQ